jgi:hypothetical protein
MNHPHQAKLGSAGGGRHMAHLTDVSDRSATLAFVVVKRTVPGRATVLAWVGTQQDLMSLVEMVQKAFQEAREAAKRELDKQRAELESDLSPSHVENLLRYQVEAYHQNWRPEASYFALRGGEKGSGPLDEVLATTVLSDLERLYIRYPRLGSASEREVQLWFTRTGTWCEVEGDDAVWVASMAHSVQQHFNRRRPSWAWLHSRFLGFTVRFYFVFAALFAFIFPALPSLKNVDLPTAYAISTAIAGILALATFGLVNSRALNRLLPRFEILPDGKTATGTRRLGWVVTLVLGAALSTYVAWYISA